MTLVSEKHKCFGGKKKRLVLGRCAMCPFWVIWVETNNRIFGDVREDELNHLIEFGSGHPYGHQLLWNLGVYPLYLFNTI